VGKTTSNNHYKMTCKERDTESGLDYYGARYYGSTMGRFMSPDWAAKPATVPYAEFGDPQSLNLYSYTRNSPIIRVDGDGHDANGMLARPGQGGILATGDGGSADDRYDVTTTYENTYVNGQLVSSVPINQTVQQVGSASLLYSGAPLQQLSPKSQNSSQTSSQHGHWEYSQSTGQMSHVLPNGNSQTTGTGYSGQGAGLNKPAEQDKPNIGPIPQGNWRIEPQQDNVTGQGHKLPASMRLEPLKGTNTYGRDGFLIHGDNSQNNHSASNGCIILNRDVRNQIGRSGDNLLTVVP
jgi:RHS repeat-associated protein